LAAAGVRVPKPILHKGNVVIMEFIGEGGIAYPLLEQAQLDDAQSVFNSVVNGARLTYQDAKLVHADLSGFNILATTPPVIIDWGQAVHRRHPRSEEFLDRDARNVCQFFQRRGVDCSADGILARIRG
ncbi:MAG: RIO1 family regulatory kinase/ATPase, partial [Candidatus Micrarchaeota archaeon]|nr:RIO1 family regulatory kinase/ATPase [Candidatus Micrarchaeota archaeon]